MVGYHAVKGGALRVHVTLYRCGDVIDKDGDRQVLGLRTVPVVEVEIAARG